jgi:hypothetical protein
MWPYWFLFLLPAWFAIRQPVMINTAHNTTSRWGHLWCGAFILFSLIIGFRDEVGGDWVNYLNSIAQAATQTWQQILLGEEPAYGLLNWIGSCWGGTYFVNTICGIIFSWGLVSFCKIQPRPWLALVVAIPYLTIVVAMGYSRQGVAIGLAMLGLVGLHHGRMWRFIFCIVLATMFHKSAIIFFPFAILGKSKRSLLAKGKRRWLVVLGAVCCMCLLYIWQVKDVMNGMMLNYIDAGYASSGATIRIAMNTFPAVVFLVFRRRFVLMTSEQRNFWTWIALSALGIVVLFWISPSSTAVDRVALYWIPLQLVIWSNLPDALGKYGERNSIWVFTVIFYSAIIQFIWLFFAVNASYWLPYKFYPWEVLWQ